MCASFLDPYSLPIVFEPTLSLHLMYQIFLGERDESAFACFT